MSILVSEFHHIKGVNDVEYIELLEKQLETQKHLTAKAIAKLNASERANGHWIPSENVGFVCSVCNKGYKVQPTCMGEPMFAFCPICGAKMQVDE